MHLTQQNQKNCSWLEKAQSSETESVGIPLMQICFKSHSLNVGLLDLKHFSVKDQSQLFKVCYKSGRFPPSLPSVPVVTSEKSSQSEIVEEMHLHHLPLLLLLLLLISFSSCCLKTLEAVGWNGFEISGSTAEYGSGDCLDSEALTCGPATFDMTISGK